VGGRVAEAVGVRERERERERDGCVRGVIEICSGNIGERERYIQDSYSRKYTK
jgi:hypothetical protein